LQNIVDGWTNLIFPDAVSEELALHRANICAKCPFAQMSSGTYTIVVDNKTKNIRGMSCGKCGCPLSAKVRAKNDSCPIGKW
jgi:transcription elongation factor Elf1